jgi:hypothetical protein
VEGLAVERLGRAELAQAPEVHDRDAVGDLLDQREVVGDEQVGEPELRTQALEEVEDLGLDEDVERRDRLVADDERRVERERAGNGHALGLAARELARAAPAVDVGIQSDGVEHLAHAPAAFLAATDAVGDERLLDDVGDAPLGVQRAERVLEDHLQRAPRVEQPAPLEADEVVALEAHGARLRARCLQHRAR